MASITPDSGSSALSPASVENKTELSKSEKALKVFGLVTNTINAVPNAVSGAVGSAVGGGVGGLIGALVPGLNARHGASKGAHEGAKWLSHGVSVATLIPVAFSASYSLLATHLGKANSFKDGLAQANQVREKISEFTQQAVENTSKDTLNDPNVAAPQIPVQSQTRNKEPPVVIGDSAIAKTLAETSLLKGFISSYDAPAQSAFKALNDLKAAWSPKNPKTVGFKESPHGNGVVLLPKLNILNRVDPNKSYTIVEQGDKKVEITGQALMDCMESVEAGTLDSEMLTPDDAERLSKEGFKDGDDHMVAHHRFAVVRNAPSTGLDDEYNIIENRNSNDRSAFLYITGIDFQGASKNHINSLQGRYFEMNGKEAKTNEVDGRLILNEGEVKKHFKSMFKKAIEEAHTSNAKCLVLPGINIGVFSNSLPSVKSEMTVLFMEALSESLEESPHTANLESVIVSHGQIATLMQPDTAGGKAMRGTFGKHSNPEGAAGGMTDEKKARMENHANLQTEQNAALLERFDKAAEKINSSGASITYTSAEAGACEHAALKNGLKPLVVVAADANAVPAFHAQHKLGNIAQDEAFGLRNPVQMLAANPVTNPRVTFAKS